MDDSPVGGWKVKNEEGLRESVFMKALSLDVKAQPDVMQ
jgi:hypothetical protein